jgi:hypothetical protein
MCGFFDYFFKERDMKNNVYGATVDGVNCLFSDKYTGSHDYPFVLVCTNDYSFVDGAVVEGRACSRSRNYDALKKKGSFFAEVNPGEKFVVFSKEAI